jgi:hypothetical protein
MKIVVKRRGKLQAGPGVKISKAKGNTLVRTRASNESPSVGSEGAAIDVPGSDGKLNKVPKHSTWAPPSTYPSLVRAGASGANVTQMDGDEILARNNGGSIYVAITASRIEMFGANELLIDESDLTHNMSIKEIDVCVAGVAKKMLVIASDPYDP